MLSIILFSLMVWAILWSYNSIQRASIKTANTQDAIQVAEDFLERINDMSIEYIIDSSKYPDNERFWHREIINTGTLYLKNKKNGKEIKFYRECSGAKCSVFITESWTNVNLVNSDKVNVTNLNFEIYPNEQYVNTNITAKVEWWESLFKSWITLSTSVWFKNYRFYAWELTPETLCEDVCSASQLSYASSNALDANASFTQIYNNNTSQLSSCVWEWVQEHSFFFWLFRWNTNYGISMYNFAKKCKDNGDNYYVSEMKTTCWSGCKFREWNINPMSCWYIRKVMESDTWYNWSNCHDYDSYVWTTACKQLCVASIFTCSDNDMIRKTWIQITTWAKAWLYLQNPKEEALTFTWTVYDNWRSCNSWNPTRYRDWILFRWEWRYNCNNWQIKCTVDGNQYNDISENQYNKWCKKPRQAQINWWLYLDQEKNPGKESCICQPKYWFSIYVDNWFVEEAWCAWWQEKQTNTNSNQPIYSYTYNPPDLYYRSRQDELKTWVWQAESQDDVAYYGWKTNVFGNYNLCSCNNQTEYDACIASGCCTSGTQIHQYDIDTSCNFLSNVITALNSWYLKECTSLLECIGWLIFWWYWYDWSKWETYTKNYCNYLWWKWTQESWKYKCYLNGTTKQDYCEKTQWWTRINNKCYQNKQNLTCPGWVIQNNTCYNNQATCSTIQNNICYSALEPLYCNWELIWNLCYLNHSYCNNLIGNTCYNTYTDCNNLCGGNCYQSKTWYSWVYNWKYYKEKTEVSYAYWWIWYWSRDTCRSTPDGLKCKLSLFGSTITCAAIETTKVLWVTVNYCYREPKTCDAIEESTRNYCYKWRIQNCSCQNSNNCYRDKKNCDKIENNRCYAWQSSCITWSTANTCYSNPTNLETECTSRWWVQLIINWSNINCYKSNTPCTLINNWICYTSQNNLKSACENEGWYFTWKNGEYYCYKNELESLETYCSNINWTMLENVCYGDNTTLDTNHNWFMWYSCVLYWEHESTNVIRISSWSIRWCFSNDSPCRDYKCVKENPTNTYTNATCTSKFGADRIVLRNNNNSTTKRCEYSKFADCIRWDTKNIYKDYTYWCDLSITSQSSMILNIIDSIWKFSSSIWSNRWCGFRVLWFCFW